MSGHKVSLLGIGVNATSYSEVVSEVDRWAQRRRVNAGEPARVICVTSVHGLITAQDDPAFREILNRADIVTPDGMPVVWALRRLAAPDQQRVYGPDLMLAICEQSARAGLRVFLYGGRPEVLPLLQVKLTSRFPELNIAGRYSPPFRPLTSQEEGDLCNIIHTADPDVIFVGISTPKQERWMSEHRAMFPGAVLIGVGAAFDFHAGRVRQAPQWMQRRGLEWLFRLMSEPARLWRRYLLETPRFIPYVAMQMLGFYKK